MPFDLEGVTVGEPIEKLGQRALPQGAIHFDDVRVPRRFAIAERDGFYPGFTSSWSWAGTFLSQASAGLARAAFEQALAYAHERVQGGALLADHQLVQYRLGRMGRSVETARAMARRVSEFAQMAPHTHPYITAQAKVDLHAGDLRGGQRGASDVRRRRAHSRNIRVEKLLRDARASLIEDGENYVLTMRFGGLLSRLYQDGWTRN